MRQMPANILENKSNWLSLDEKFRQQLLKIDIFATTWIGKNDTHFKLLFS